MFETEKKKFLKRRGSNDRQVTGGTLCYYTFIRFQYFSHQHKRHAGPRERTYFSILLHSEAAEAGTAHRGRRKKYFQL